MYFLYNEYLTNARKSYVYGEIARKGVDQMIWLPWQQSLRGRKAGSKISILN